MLILYQPDFQLQRNVYLGGEVRFPGEYALRRKDERISDVIQRAGGLTAEADVTAADFTRLRVETTFQGARAADATRLRIGLDLERALNRRGSENDIVLLDGDALVVPARRSTIEIQGQVQAPRAVTVNSGKSLGYYLMAAGGVTTEGDRRRAYVIQPDGRVQTTRHLLWGIPLQPTPRPGATVVVPTREQRPSSAERAATVAVLAQAITSIAAIIVVLR